MIASQGNIQVYSPFGTYVVEQHDAGFEQPRHWTVAEPPVVRTKPIDPKPTNSKDLPKAA